MAGPTTTDQPAPTSATNSSRIIPGLSSQPQNSNTSKRSRKKKTTLKIDDPTKAPATADEASQVIEPAAHIASPPEPLNGVATSVPPPPSSVSTSPVQQVQKRIRAATKKLQRIGGCESSTVPLNEDQKRAVASKPAVEATIKELQDLLKILEEDEKLEELRIQAVRKEEELKVQGRVDSVIASEQKKAESSFTFLLQFLHLYSLVHSTTRPTESFVPPVVPPVIQSATAQELAAVNVLFHQLADGPISGGDGDAFSSISRFTEGSTVDVVEGVTFARLKEMVIQLSASPGEVGIAPKIQSSTEDVTGVDQEVAADNPSASYGNMMFLQQSEVIPTLLSNPAENGGSVSTPDLLPPNSVSELKIDHVARNKQLLEQATILPSEHVATSIKEWSNGEQPPTEQRSSTPANAEEWNTPVEHLSATQAEVVARTIDWAEDVQGQGDGQDHHPTDNAASIPPSSSLVSNELASAQVPPAPPQHHMNNGRGNYRGRGGYRGGPGIPRGGGNTDGYRGGRGWYKGNTGLRGGRGGPPPMDMNGHGGWRPGPGGVPEPNGGYRPRADYAGGRYGGHRGGPRGGNAFHRHGPPPPQVYHPEVAGGPGGTMY